MKISKALLFGLLFICTQFLWAEVSCGTQQLVQRHRSYVPQGAARSARLSTTDCAAEFYYDTNSVLEHLTDHFRIYYVLEGPHATTERFIDSLAIALEVAWEAQIRNRKAKVPTGANPTWHFQKSGDSNLYPVEVLDISLVRDNAELLGGFCSGCMGLTFSPDFEKPLKTEIIIDNDFLYPNFSSKVGFSDSCTYPIAEIPMTNNFTGKDYSVDFGLAIRTTAHHEFYHAIQSSYVNILESDNYWFEPSASAVEELNVPEANDYWSGLLNFFSSPGKTFGQISSNSELAVLGLFNAKFLGDSFDIKLWERFSKMPDSSFEIVYTKELEKRNIDADSLFADFAARLFFSGSRFDSTRVKLSFTEDFPKWPSAPRQHSPTREAIVLEPPAIDYYKLTADSMPNLSEFCGKASVAFYKSGKAPKFYSLDTIALESLTGAIQKAENAVLILSRLRDSTSAIPQPDTLPMRAYPNPWRGNSPLCFAGLPTSKSKLEIRTRIGKLVRSYEYQGSSFHIEAQEVFDRMAPGLYFFRVGKTRAKPFILAY